MRSPASGGWRRFLPRPFELFTYAMAVVVVLALRAGGVRLGGSAVRYIVDAVLHHLLGLTLLGLALQLVGQLVARRSLRAWLRELLTPASLGLWVRLWLALAGVTFAYAWLKVSVPLLRRDVLDGFFWELDRIVHLGISPTVFVVELAKGTPLVGWIDLWYALWLTSVLAVQSWAFLFTDLARRRHFAFACAALWLVAVWVYLLLPAVGPCYFVPDAFDEVRAAMPHAEQVQGRLWEHYLQVIAAREQGTRPRLSPFLAVAAMPSLHVGAHWLFALWARRQAPRLFLPFSLATLLTFFGSILTGWHYAIDAYLGMLIAWLAVRAADRFEPVAAAAAAAAGGGSAGSGTSPLPAGGAAGT
jgi:hypothetical protein